MTRSYRPLRLVVVILLLAVLLGFVAGTVGAPPSGPLGVATAEAHRNPAGLSIEEMKRIHREDMRVRAFCGEQSIWWPTCQWGVWAFHQSWSRVGHHGYHVRTWGVETHILINTDRKIHVTSRYIHNAWIRSRYYVD